MKKKKWLLGVGVLACGIVLCACARYQNTSTVRPPDRYGQEIEQLHSFSDRDGDGVDDQADILEGALSYVGQKPKYKSRYYESGYPDDGFGVCTDVVANALKNAGYDLRELVQEDIEKNGADYGIDEPDDKIDFRRVKNLQVFFAHRATALTTDPRDIGEWQGGDIVIFKKHIGIVSDRRNKDGVPYVIHHSNPWQIRYEQDILEYWGEIVGHYRVEG